MVLHAYIFNKSTFVTCNQYLLVSKLSCYFVIYISLLLSDLNRKLQEIIAEGDYIHKRELCICMFKLSLINRKE